MKNGAFFLLIVLILGLIFAPFLGGSYKEGYDNRNSNNSDKVNLDIGVTREDEHNSDHKNNKYEKRRSGHSYDNYDHYSKSSAPSTFYGWMERESEESEELRMIFGRARFALAEAAFSEALQRSRDLMDEPEVDSARVGAARLLVDTLKWYAERLNPRQYAMQRVEPIAQTVHNVTNNNLTMIDGASLCADQRSALRAMLTQARDSKVIDN